MAASIAQYETHGNRILKKNATGNYLLLIGALYTLQCFLDTQIPVMLSPNSHAPEYNIILVLRFTRCEYCTTSSHVGIRHSSGGPDARLLIKWDTVYFNKIVPYVLLLHKASASPSVTRFVYWLWSDEQFITQRAPSLSATSRTFEILN